MTSASVILKVLWGPEGGRKRAIAVGGALRVGRLPPSDWELAFDRDLSAEHFEIRWDGTRASLVDLDSLGGTAIDGRTRGPGEHPLRPGSWIRAGGTDFRVFLEGRSRRATGRGAPPRGADAALARLTTLRESGDLHALVDASRGDRVLELLDASIDVGRSLYEGVQGVALEASAPFLVRLDPASALLERLVMEGWDLGWASYFTSAESERDLRRHFRRFLFVEAEGIPGRVYFRFYDPRVLRDFVAIATPMQRAELLGPIDRLVLPSEDGSPIDVVGGSGEGAPSSSEVVGT